MLVKRKKNFEWRTITLLSLLLLTISCVAARRVTIRGKVFWGEQAQPNVQVYLHSPSGQSLTTITDENGSFNFVQQTARPTVYWLDARPPAGFGEVYEPVNVSSTRIPAGLTTDIRLPRLTMRYSLESLKAEPEIVEVFYATDRASTGTSHLPDYGPEPSRTRKISLGLCKVSLPPGHRWGLLEEPSPITVWGFEIYEEALDPNKHFVLKGDTISSQR